VLSFQRAASGAQQATLLVGRESKDEDLSIRVTINAAEENMARIPEGSVSLPQQGPGQASGVRDRPFEFPTRPAASRSPASRARKPANTARCRAKNSVLPLNGCARAWATRSAVIPMENPTAQLRHRNGCRRPEAPVLSGQYPQCRTPKVSTTCRQRCRMDRKRSAGSRLRRDWTSPVRYADLTVSCRARSLPEEVAKEHLGFRCCKNK